jgi:glycerol-3-phosphate acyltransferase PlsY
MTVFTWALIGYAAGCFPSAWLVALAVGRRDVLDRVKRNVGEADAHVLLSQAPGRSAAVAATLDILKGLVPLVVAVRWADAYAIGACAIAVVAGHCWPPLLSRYAGRGLAAAAGAFLGFLPVEMVLAGVVRILGSAVRAGGLASTIGYIAIPVLAVIRGQPLPHVFAAVVINLLIFARRLEGVSGDIGLGVPVGRAVFRRAVLDVSAYVPGPRRI